MFLTPWSLRTHLKTSTKCVYAITGGGGGNAKRSGARSKQQNNTNKSCKVCHATFQSKTDLALHYESEHGIENAIKTKLYKRTSYKSQASRNDATKNNPMKMLNDYIIANTNNKTCSGGLKLLTRSKSPCPGCPDFMFNSRFHLVEHIIRRHEVDCLPCPHCMQTLGQGQHLKMHLVKHKYIFCQAIACFGVFADGTSCKEHEDKCSILKEEAVQYPSCSVVTVPKPDDDVQAKLVADLNQFTDNILSTCQVVNTKDVMHQDADVEIV